MEELKFESEDLYSDETEEDKDDETADRWSHHFSFGLGFLITLLLKKAFVHVLCHLWINLIYMLDAYYKLWWLYQVCNIDMY